MVSMQLNFDRFSKHLIIQTLTFILRIGFIISNWSKLKKKKL